MYIAFFRLFISVIFLTLGTWVQIFLGFIISKSKYINRMKQTRNYTLLVFFKLDMQTESFSNLKNYECLLG